MLCKKCGKPLNTQTGGCNWCLLGSNDDDLDHSSFSPGDGLGGTDGVSKVIPLFGSKADPGKAPPQGSQEMVEMLEKLAQEAATGRLTGLCIVAFYGSEQFKCGTGGHMRYTAALGGLEDLKYKILKQGPTYK